MKNVQLMNILMLTQMNLFQCGKDGEGDDDDDEKRKQMLAKQ